jgi:hypothetical protein
LTLNRWVTVASWWERFLANAATIATVLAVMAWLMFPAFATTSGWLWKVLAVVGLALAAAGAQEVTLRPAMRVFGEALTGLSRAQRAQVLKALRGGAVPSDPAVLAAAIRVGAIGQAYQQRYSRSQKTSRFLLPAIYLAMAALQFFGYSGTQRVHQALMWLGLAVYFGVYSAWIAHRARQLDRAVPELRTAAINVPAAASAAAQTAGPVKIPPRRIWASLLAVVIVGAGFGAAIWALGGPFPDPAKADCRTTREMLYFNSRHEDMFDARLVGTGTPALAEYQAWSEGLQTYAQKVSDPAVSGHLKKVAELSEHAVAVAHDLRRNPAQTPSPAVIEAHENDYRDTITELVNEQSAAVTFCNSPR